MKFYIVTPSYNQVDWLKLCVASVADQAAEGEARGAGRIEVHHFVQDARSTDGTVEWLEEYISRQPSTDSYQLTFVSEADKGMYDAVNRGWEKTPADADIIAHLNCDEQYLPDALRNVAVCFQKHSKDDVVFADMIVIDGNGKYICHRRPLPPWPVYSRLFIPGFTCTTFQRRHVFFEKGCRFDTAWKNLGDTVWFASLVKKGCRFRMLNAYTSVFVYAGDNLSHAPSADMERTQYKQTLPGWLEKMRPAGLLLKRVRYVLRMAWSRRPASYSLFLPGVPGGRQMITIDRPTVFWPKNWVGRRK